jgi:3'-phosphoadenosine 5'-phosphosulfate sulfotransferase (PAPS reductase)/FAD synthetase
VLGRHKHAALNFSGGKDSLALLHLARPWLDEITVFFGDTGAVYPHVVDFVHKTCADLGATLVTVKPPMSLADYHEKFGLPSDIVPVDASPEMAPYIAAKPKQMLQSPLMCCGNMIWNPIQQAIRERGIMLVLRGSKKCDPHVGAPPGTIDADGREYASPLWDWSDEDVMKFLADKEMPAQYPEIKDSMDCWACTGFMGGQYAKAKLEYARKHYPDLWPQMNERIVRVRETVAAETARINEALSVAQ